MDQNLFIIDAIFLSFAVLSAISDLYYRKIFNSLIISAIVLGISLNIAYFGLSGLKESLIGLLCGFSLIFVFYLMGGVGAGDVKFLAAVGSMKGAGFVLMGGFYGALIAGAASIYVLARKKRFFSTLKETAIAAFLFAGYRKKEHIMFDSKDSIYLPYAVFLSLGLIIRWFEIMIKR